MKKTQTIPLPPKFLEDQVGGVNANPYHKAREQKTFPGSYCWRRRRTALRLAGPCQHKLTPAGSTSSGRARYCWPTADQLSAWTTFHAFHALYLSFAASELHPVGFFSSLFPIWQDFSYSKPVLQHTHSPFWVGPAWFKEPKLWMTVSPLNFPKVFADHIFLNECVFTTSVHDAWTAGIWESPYPPLINWLLLSAENKDNQLLGFLNFWILLLFFFFFNFFKISHKG